jgi:glycosyltransferase involved in cell wall biosynthesis
MAAIATGTPVLNSERSHNYKLAPLNRLAHLLTRRLASGVIANSHSGKQFAERLFGLGPDDVHVVWNGIELEELERQAATGADLRCEFFGPGEYRVACLVGSIKPAKDYRLALEAAERLTLEHPEWRVLLVGDQLSAVTAYRPGRHSDSGAYKAEVLKHYQKLAGRERIRFTGLRTDVPAILRRCDLLYITSRHEGSPNVVLEAMALGVPVVSTEYSDIRQMLPFGQQVVSERSPEALSRAMLWAYAHREAIIALQRRWVQTHARIENVALELERVYRKYTGARISAQPA